MGSMVDGLPCGASCLMVKCNGNYSGDEILGRGIGCGGYVWYQFTKVVVVMGEVGL